MVGTQNALPGYSIILGESESKYHSDENRKTQMSSGRLKTFRRNPLLFRREQLGLIPQRTESEAMKIGTATHKLKLEGRAAYESSYCFGGPINPKTNRPYGSETKKFFEWQREQGKPCLSGDQSILVERMVNAIENHKEAAVTLSDGTPEVVIRGKRLGVDCQIRIDWLAVDLHDEYFADLKTCADLDKFVSGLRREKRAIEGGYRYTDDMQYIHQVAFYRDIARQALERPTLDAVVVAVEKQEPYRVGVFVFSDLLLGQATARNHQALSDYRECVENDRWPTGFEGVQEI